jgi:hypothetical protein
VTPEPSVLGAYAALLRAQAINARPRAFRADNDWLGVVPDLDRLRDRQLIDRVLVDLLV